MLHFIGFFFRLFEVGKQERVRTLFKNILGITQDDEFINHEEADPTVISSFENTGVPKPTLNDLHFDMLGNVHSIWNTTIFHLLRIRFVEDEKTKGWQLPVMSDEYIESLISDRFTRLKAVWTQGSRQFRFDGHLETQEEIQARLVQSREERLKAARHRERRATVRVSIIDTPVFY